MDEFDFREKSEYRVDVFHEDVGEIGKAKLYFGEYGAIRLLLEDSIFSPHVKGSARFDVLKTKSELGESFTLFGCKCFGYMFYADFLVMGDVDDEFSEIRIHYSGITSWFARWQKIEGRIGEQLTWVNHPEPVKVVVNRGSYGLEVRTEAANGFNQVGEDYIFHEHVDFLLSKTSGFFLAKEVRQESLDLANLLSILLANPISVISADVTSKTGRPYCAYFGAFKRVEKHESNQDFPQKCLLPTGTLDGRWQSVFQNYNDSTHREVSWRRMAGMQRYEGFWEYGVLGYVSLLDKYVTQRSKGQVKPFVSLSAKRKAWASNELNKIRPALDVSQHAKVLALMERSHSRSREPNFAEQFDYCLNQSSPDVVKIINITNDEFKHIKDIRDAIAHGDAITQVSDDLTRVTQIIDKITLIMMYWAHLDFGLKDEDFYNWFGHNHNHLSLNQGIDKRHLEKMKGVAKFLLVSKKEFNKINLSRKSRIYIFLEIGVRGGVKYSERYTRLYESYLRENKTRNGLVTFKDIFSLENDYVVWSGKIYVDHGDETLLLDIAHLIEHEPSQSK
jgi:hypothetical protein